MTTTLTDDAEIMRHHRNVNDGGRVYNETTIPIAADDEAGETTTVLPRASIHRWLPSSQRNLLQRQAELFAKPKAPAPPPPPPTETDIF